MKIIEHFSQAKTPHSDGEDGWVMTEHYAAVIDGSTSKAGQNFPDHLTPGRKAMLTVREAIRSLHPEAELNEVLNISRKHCTTSLPMQAPCLLNGVPPARLPSTAHTEIRFGSSVIASALQTITSTKT